MGNPVGFEFAWYTVHSNFIAVLADRSRGGSMLLSWEEQRMWRLVKDHLFECVCEMAGEIGGRIALEVMEKGVCSG